MKTTKEHVKRGPKPKNWHEDKELLLNVDIIKKLYDIVKNVNLAEELKQPELSYEASVFVWQFCRNNPSYQEYYLNNILEGNEDSNELGEFLWGFNNLLDPTVLIPPDTFKFKFKKAWLIENDDSSKSKDEIEVFEAIKEIKKLHGNSIIQFKLFVYANMKWDDVEQLIKPQFNEAMKLVKKSHSFNLITLPVKLLCSEILDLKLNHLITQTGCEDIFRTVLSGKEKKSGSTLEYARMLDYRNDFKNICRKSPAIFFQKMK